MSEHRQQMIDVMRQRGYSVGTHQAYFGAVRDLARYYRLNCRNSDHRPSRPAASATAAPLPSGAAAGGGHSDAPAAADPVSWPSEGA